MLPTLSGSLETLRYYSRAIRADYLPACCTLIVATCPFTLNETPNEVIGCTVFALLIFLINCYYYASAVYDLRDADRCEILRRLQNATLAEVLSRPKGDAAERQWRTYCERVQLPTQED